jgi:hypothetical protein
MWLFVAVPEGYRPAHGVNLVTKQAKSRKEFEAFAAENPGAVYALEDLSTPRNRLGGGAMALKFAAQALGAEAEQIKVRAQVAAVTASVADYNARQAAGFKAMQLRHTPGCPYRLLAEHAQHICTCGFKVEE